MAYVPGTESVAVDVPPGDRHEQDEDRCPSCDARGAWRTSRRHRFSTFGTVTLVVLSFWATVFGWLLDYGYIPSLVLLLLGVFLALATRNADLCEACGYVRPKRHS
ncbi:MAG: hypothetical protein ACE5HV_08490 [Acidobacteriota bacterium]